MLPNHLKDKDFDTSLMQMCAGGSHPTVSSITTELSSSFVRRPKPLGEVQTNTLVSSSYASRRFQSGLEAVLSEHGAYNLLPTRLRNAVNDLVRFLHSLPSGPSRSFHNEAEALGDLWAPPRVTRMKKEPPDPPGPTEGPEPEFISEVNFQDFSKFIQTQMALHYPGAGYSYVIGKGHDFKGGAGVGYSRLGVQKMNIHQPIALASISKLITAVAVLRALESNTGDWNPAPTLNSPIARHFPSTWKKNEVFSLITFENCLQYRSGLSTQAGHDWELASTVSWVTQGKYFDMTPPKGMQSQEFKIVKDGEYGIGGKAQYNNASFAWFRIALFYLTVPKSLREAMDLISVLSPDFWHKLVSTYYRDYIKNTVFPKNLQADVTPHFGEWNSSNATLYYHYPDFKSYSGFPFGSNLLLAGGIGWFLSAVDLARFFGALSQGYILSGTMLNKLFGFDHPGFGRSYAFDAYTKRNIGFQDGHYISKGGALLGVATELVYFPSTDIYVTLLSNFDLKNSFETPSFPKGHSIELAIYEAYGKAWSQKKLP